MENNGTQGQVDPPSIAWKPKRTGGHGGRRARADKPTSPQGKRALKLSVDVDTHERLALHALRRGQTISQVVMDLAGRHLNDWVIHAKPGVRGDDGN